MTTQITMHLQSDVESSIQLLTTDANDKFAVLLLNPSRDTTILFMGVTEKSMAKMINSMTAHLAKIRAHLDGPIKLA